MVTTGRLTGSVGRRSVGRGRCLREEAEADGVGVGVGPTEGRHRHGCAAGNLKVPQLANVRIDYLKRGVVFECCCWGLLLFGGLVGRERVRLVRRENGRLVGGEGQLQVP